MSAEVEFVLHKHATIEDQIFAVVMVAYDAAGSVFETRREPSKEAMQREAFRRTGILFKLKGFETVPEVISKKIKRRPF